MVIDLPLPDSPTIPRLLAVSSAKLTPSTALLTPRRLISSVLRPSTSSSAKRGLLSRVRQIRDYAACCDRSLLTRDAGFPDHGPPPFDLGLEMGGESRR